jgi:hypothetical protein
MHQLIDWLRDPIPASEMMTRFNPSCRPGGAGAVSAKTLSPTEDGSLTPGDLTPTPTPAATPGAAPAPAPTPSEAPNTTPTVAVPSTSAPALAPAAIQVLPDSAINAGGAAAPAALAAAAFTALALALLL